nr:uncharacterized protein LOC114823295 [Malus domestica]
MEIIKVHVLLAEFQPTIHQPDSSDGDMVAKEATQVDFIATEEDEQASKADKLKAALAILFPHSSSVLIFWDGKSVVVHPADNQPFESNMIQAQYYDDHVGYIALQGLNEEGRSTQISIQKAIKAGAEIVYQESVRLGLADLIADIDTVRSVDWLANIVPILKKNGALCICIDFRNLNIATPKDRYPMPISDLLINVAANHEILSFMDGHASYNQIFITKTDVHKTAFDCLGALGTYKWVIMPFSLTNAGATCQRAMNTIFHDLIGTTVEVYIDDVVINSQRGQTYLDDLRQAFLRMHQHNFKMNPAKCAFDLSAGNFLGFLVHHRGIEVDENKT